jgi:hydroxymethylbilane synthase
MQKIKIGTRNSALALWQANYIGNLLTKQGFSYELVAISTKGDQILDRSLAKIGSKGVFTEELEQMLRNGEIDIAQHSAKDLPSSLPPDLELIAFTERENAQDVVLSLNNKFKLSDPQPKIIGTSSTRRRAMLSNQYPQHTLIEMRGNLQTRLEKLKNGDCDAILLAYAGVHRMEMEEFITQFLPIEQFVPAVGQGSVAIQTAKSLAIEVKEKIRHACNHPITEKCLLAERHLLSLLDGGCSVPVYGHATLKEEQIHLVGGVLSLDGQVKIEEQQSGATSIEVGENTATLLIQKGAQNLLKEIRQQLKNE